MVIQLLFCYHLITTPHAIGETIRLKKMVSEMAQNRNSTDMAETRAGNGKVVSATPFKLMIQAMARDASADNSEFAGDDLNDILSAETMEEMWDADERPPLNFQHLAGCDISIIDFEVKFGRGTNTDIKTPFITDDGKQMYLLVKAVRLSEPEEKTVIKLPEIGAEFQANTSARFIVAKIWRAYTLGSFSATRGIPLDCHVKEIDLGGGNAVLKLRPIRNASVRATAE